MKSYTYTNTEKYIENEVDVSEQYYVKVECKVSTNGFPIQRINDFFDNHLMYQRFLPHGFSNDFDVVDTDVSEPYDVWWKIRNIGEEAQFFGRHYLECYIIKDGRCVAIDHANVPIGHS